jgi:hypothetical protein
MTFVLLYIHHWSIGQCFTSTFHKYNLLSNYDTKAHAHCQRFLAVAVLTLATLGKASPKVAKASIISTAMDNFSFS